MNVFVLMVDKSIEHLILVYEVSFYLQDIL